MNNASCRTGDLVRGRSALWLWYLPALAVLIGLALPHGRPWFWIPAFSVMGVACLANAARCGRLHCYVTGPVFLLTAIYVLLAVFNRAPMYAGPAFAIGLVITVLGFIAERPFGTYRK
jgi:hypothetical protein